MHRYPSAQVARINLRPLIPPGALEKINPQRVLRAVQRQVVKRIQSKILASNTLSHRAKVALTNGFEVRRGAHSITVIAKHPAFRPLLEGRKLRQMRWLMKADRPIPIITKEGKLIFRNATPRSMENGSWYHPQRQPTTIIEKAREEAREVIKARLAKEFRKEIRKALARAGR
jgi:hypothetical protein